MALAKTITANGIHRRLHVPHFASAVSMPPV
jgi:hypothetical protein